MPEKRWYIEEHELPAPWGWVIIILFSASIAGFGWLVYSIIPDTARRWDFGQLPDTPAESIYSTDQPRPSGRPQRQLLKLPEAGTPPGEASPQAAPDPSAPQGAANQAIPQAAPGSPAQAAPGSPAPQAAPGSPDRPAEPRTK